MSDVGSQTFVVVCAGAVFCRQGRGAASNRFELLYIYHMSQHEKNPGMVPHASCYLVLLHAATTLQVEVTEKCDLKGVKGQAAAAETFRPDIRLKAQSRLKTHTTTIGSSMLPTNVAAPFIQSALEWVFGALELPFSSLKRPGGEKKRNIKRACQCPVL